MLQHMHPPGGRAFLLQRLAMTGWSAIMLASVAVSLLSCATATAKSEKEVFNEVAPRVVLVETYDFLMRRANQGSGIILGPSACAEQREDNDGGVGRGSMLTKGADILTNFHVIERAEFIVVRTRDGQSAQADIVFFERERDIAVLRIPIDFEKADIPLAPNVEVGDKTIAMGNPKGLGWTISTGIVSRVPDKEAGLIQTTAALSSGSSGGGLLDSDGRLIGITTATLESGQSLNFAVWLRGGLLDDIQASRRGISFSPGGIWNTDWIVGEYRWDPKWLLNPQWEDTFRKNSRFARYMALRKKVREKEEEWSKREDSVVESLDRNASPMQFKAAFDRWSKRKAAYMAPLWETMYREFPNDLDNAVSLVEAVDDEEQRAALLEQLVRRWPSDFGVLEAAATYYATEARDSKHAFSILRRLHAGVLSLRENHDPKLSHAGSAGLWKLSFGVLKDRRMEMVRRFNSLVSRLNTKEMPCRSLAIASEGNE